MFNIFVINTFLVVVTVYIHYEILNRLALLLPKLPVVRFRVAVGMLGAICGHVIEISLFAAAYYLVAQVGNLGALIEVSNERIIQNFLDCWYFSFSTYSSLGYGDIVPLGNLRFLSGIEALIGLVMITWSASFMYLEMEKYWRHGEP